MNVDEIVKALEEITEYIDGIKSQLLNDVYRNFKFKPKMLFIYESETNNIYELLQNISNNLKRIITSADEDDIEKAIKIIIKHTDSDNEFMSDFKNSDEYFMLLAKYIETTIDTMNKRERLINKIRKEMEDK